jgi:hypothetical protein
MTAQGHHGTTLQRHDNTAARRHEHPITQPHDDTAETHFVADPYDDRPQGLLNNLLRKVPGFAGYVDREAREASDLLARQNIAQHLERAKRALEGITRALVDRGAIDALPKFDRFRGTVDHTIAKLRGAPAGYHGFFAIDDVQDDLLEDVYEHDLWTIDEAEKFAVEIEALAEAEDAGVDANALLKQMKTHFEAIEAKIKQREQILAEL